MGPQPVGPSRASLVRPSDWVEAGLAGMLDTAGLAVLAFAVRNGHQVLIRPRSPSSRAAAGADREAGTVASRWPGAVAAGAVTTVSGWLMLALLRRGVSEAVRHHHGVGWERDWARVEPVWSAR